MISDFRLQSTVFRLDSVSDTVSVGKTVIAIDWDLDLDLDQTWKKLESINSTLRMQGGGEKEEERIIV